MIIVVFNAFLMTFFSDLFIRFSRLPYSVSNPPTLIPGIEATQNSNDVFNDDDDSQEAITNNDDINIVYSVDKSKI